MKTKHIYIMSIALILLFKVDVFAQELTTGSYLPIPDNKKFIGNWILVNKKDTIKLEFKLDKKVYFEALKVYTDFIIGSIRFSSKDIVNNTYTTKKFVLQNSIAIKNSNILNTSIIDESNNSSPIVFELIDDKLNFRIVKREEIIINKAKPIKDKLKFPINGTFIRTKK